MKILFVDDKFFMLESLQIRLVPICQNWDMEFTESGADALSLLAQKPFDVIVSDMHMPSISGPQLLDEVMKRFPNIVRVLLVDPPEGGTAFDDDDDDDGVAYKELTYEEVVAANKRVPTAVEAEAYDTAHSKHVCVPKNCPAEDLKAAILSACGGDEASQGDKLEKLMARITRIPSIPTLYLELVNLMKNPDAYIEDIGAVIARDMTMTAIVLKMANSACFGLQRVVSNTSEATMYLGMDTLRSLVLSAQVFSQYQSLRISGFSVDALGKHCLKTAAAAKIIAKMETRNRDMAEEAFVAGILHDIGKLVMASNFPTQYAEVIRLATSTNMEHIKAEQEVFGVSHADVGGRLLKLWELPLAVVEAVTWHHEPGKANKDTFTTLTAVHAANVIVQQNPTQGGVPTGPRLDINHMGALGLTGRNVAWREALLSA